MSELVKNSKNPSYDVTLAVADVPTIVKVGSKLGKFVPNVNMSKWDDEVFLNVNHPDIVGVEKPVSYPDGKVSLTVGNNTHRFYPLGDNSLEYEIIFAGRPSSDIIEFDLTFPDGLTFAYQPPLDQIPLALHEASADANNIYDKDGNVLSHRPDNIIGSYSVDWNKANNEYKTGKLCHIYRPELVDAIGDRQWAMLYIDPVTKKMTITMPEAWLNNATYPVTLGPNFGYETAGGTTYQLWEYIMGTAYTGAVGTLTHIVVYIKSQYDAGRNYRTVVYKDSDDSLVDHVPEQTLPLQGTPWWDSVAVNLGASITAVDYKLGWWYPTQGNGTRGPEFYYDTGVTGFFDPVTYTAGAPPDPLVPTAWPDRKFSIYATYTVAGAGPANNSLSLMNMGV